RLGQPPVNLLNLRAIDSSQQRLADTIVVKLNSKLRAAAAQELGRSQRADQWEFVAGEPGCLVSDLRINRPSSDSESGHESSRTNGKIAHARIKHHSQSNSRGCLGVGGRGITRALLEQKRIAARLFDDRLNYQFMT